MAARINKAAEKGEMPESWKQQSRISALAKLLEDHASGKRELSNTQVRSIEIILSKTVPSLTSVEQRTIDDRDKLTEEQITTMLVGLMAGNATIVETLLRIIIQADPGAIERVKVAQAHVAPPDASPTTTSSTQH